MDKQEIEIKRQVSKFFKIAEQRAKSNHCALCNKFCLSFANSHSVPQFVIKRIADNGKLITYNDLEKLAISKHGVKNAWTFHSICQNCENTNFSTYENEELLLSEPTNKMMAEIALKNALLMKYKYRIDRELDRQAVVAGMIGGETDVLSIINTLNIKDIDFEIRRSKKIIDKNLKSGYRLIYYKQLDWVAPIAFQNELCIHQNIDGNILNDIYNKSEKVRMQFLHVCVFPLKQNTVVMIFAHRDDRNYVPFERQFLKLDDERKLEYINGLILNHSEHILISPVVYQLILQSYKLLDLFEKVNFLSKEFALYK